MKSLRGLINAPLAIARVACWFVACFFWQLNRCHARHICAGLFAVLCVERSILQRVVLLVVVAVLRVPGCDVIAQAWQKKANCRVRGATTTSCCQGA